MVHISILALRRAVLASIADARYVFTMVNTFLQEAGQEPLFRVQLVGLQDEVCLEEGLFTLRPETLVKDLAHTDLIIIPALTGDMFSATWQNQDYAAWIAAEYRKGTEIASLCTGAFLLAYSGLLRDRQCTTHWRYANELRHLYPAVDVIDERVITHQQGLYSSGGSNAWWNLLLHLVEKYTGRDMAIRTAKYFVIDLDRIHQSPFIIFNGLRDHADVLILEIQEYIEQHYADPMAVDPLAIRFNLHRRTFERRFKKATRHTVSEYIQKVRVEASKKQLETGQKTLLEIMLEVGYEDIQTFRAVFKRVTGMTPSEYRAKYSYSSLNSLPLAGSTKKQ